MTLLQALQGATGVGVILFNILAIIVIIIGSMFLTGFLMRIYWRLIGRKQYIIENKPYYKDPFPFLICACLSIVIVTSFLYLWFILLLKNSYG